MLGVGLIEFKDNGEGKVLDFYVPSLERCQKTELHKPLNMYCPKLKEIDTTGYGKPNVLYVSQDFDVSRLPEDWKMAVRYYTSRQLKK